MNVFNQPIYDEYSKKLNRLTVKTQVQLGLQYLMAIVAYNNSPPDADESLFKYHQQIADVKHWSAIFGTRLRSQSDKHQKLGKMAPFAQQLGAIVRSKTLNEKPDPAVPDHILLYAEANKVEICDVIRMDTAKLASNLVLELNK